MRAIVQNKYGSPDTYELEEIARPTADEGQVLIRVYAAGVNPADWHMMTGTPRLVRIGGGGFLKPKANVPGLDLAGRVEAVGDGVTEFQVGDDVFGEAGRGYAEYATAAVRQIVSKPANLTFEEAAAVPIAALTALQGLRDKGQIEAGQRVLVNGASGGVGTFAVQIAKAFGAEVTAVASTRNLEMVKSIGADHVIDYTEEDFTKSGQFDLVFDAVGTRSLSDCRRALTPAGRYVAASGPKASHKMLGRMLAMMVRSMRRPQKMMSMLAKSTPDDLAALRDLLESGEVTPVMDRTYPLDQAADALRYQGEGHAQGKTVITVIDESEEA
ncbi:MAG: NAD(P)-dependent alcohol dehydrogenase [bacterium]|nr:NAD(P)-dependent alcohol dehydrogenase [bacterium]